MNRAFTLTEEQEHLVSLRDGAFLVVAPPGSGKTEVLAQRIVRLIQTSPEQGFKVLALSFTKNAAATMRRRVGERLGEFTWRVTCTTYHSFCMDVLRNYSDLAGLPSDFTVYDGQEDRLQALAQGLVEEGLLNDAAEIDRTEAMAVLDAIGRLKRDLVPVSAAPSRRVGQFRVLLADAYRAYELALNLNGAVDFDGVISKACDLLRAQPDVCSQYRTTYRFILIDEAQDTSTAQYALLTALCGAEHRNVFMVADPAQSIYAFAGASSKFIELFERDFGAQRLELGLTFRCGAEILRLARPLLAGDARARGGSTQTASAPGIVALRELENEQEEAVAVLDWAETTQTNGLPPAAVGIDESTDVSAEQIAILARSRNNLREVLEELDRRGTAYHFSTGDAGLFDTEEYRSLLYGLKVLANGKDIAICRGLVASLRRALPSANIGDYDESLEPQGLLGSLAVVLSDTSMAEPLRALATAVSDTSVSLNDVVKRLIEWDPAQAVSSPEEIELLSGDREVLEQRWVTYRNRPEGVQRGCRRCT